jgi:Uri superfamily endonuclease
LSFSLSAAAPDYRAAAAECQLDSCVVIIGDWPVSPGAYVLILQALAPTEVNIGRLGQFTLPAGRYAYLGSAQGPGGLAARLARHARPDKRIHWHIDYVTAVLPLIHVYVLEGHQRLECVWTRRLLALPGARAAVAGFGNGDCRAGCPAHLVRLPDDLSLARLEEILLP